MLGEMLNGISSSFNNLSLNFTATDFAFYPFVVANLITSILHSRSAVIALMNVNFNTHVQYVKSVIRLISQSKKPKMSLLCQNYILRLIFELTEERKDIFVEVIYLTNVYI